MSWNTGLAILATLSLVDIADLAFTDGQYPPYSVAMTGAVLGVASLVLVAFAWRRRRWALWSLILLRVLAALSALPAFLAGNVPLLVQILAAAIVGLTALGIVLVGLPQRTMEAVR